MQESSGNYKKGVAWRVPHDIFSNKVSKKQKVKSKQQQSSKDLNIKNENNSINGTINNIKSSVNVKNNPSNLNDDRQDSNHKLKKGTHLTI